jgi:4-alpha-glucanotransferase
VQIFEKTSEDPPAFRSPLRQEAATLVSFSTHDLPTWQGWRTGRDIAARHRLGGIDDATAAKARKHRGAEVGAFDRMSAEWRPEAAPAGTPRAMHSALAASRARLAMVQVETLLDMADQPNLPGTVDSYPNWRQRLPVGTDALHDLPALAETATTMTSARR